MAMTTATFFTFMVKCGPHTFLQEYVQRLHQHFTQGYPTTLGSMTKVLVSEVLEEMKLTEAEAENVRFFVGTDTEAYSWGGLGTKYGMRLMLPEFINYEKVGDVKIADYRFGTNLSSDKDNQPHTLSREDLENNEVKIFQESLVLSEKAKKFIVAREIERGKAEHFKFYSLIMPAGILLTFVTCRTLNNVLPRFRRVKALRLINYTLTGFTFAFTVLLTQDYFRKKYEGQYDEAACRIGKEYAEGGVEYYDKTIRKNKALRVIVPNEAGKKMYNLNGEAFSGIFRTKFLKFSQRRELCQKFLIE